MDALIVVDVQNEFSPMGQRAVPNHSGALESILAHVDAARKEGRPIAWVQHHNRPDESRAFVPGSWGAELSPGMGPKEGHGPERLFVKDVFGAFTGTGTALEEWLRLQRATGVLVVGFFAHMCVSTTVREALMRGFEATVDPDAVRSRDLHDKALGRLTESEVRRSALLQLIDMGATLVRPDRVVAPERLDADAGRLADR